MSIALLICNDFKVIGGEERFAIVALEQLMPAIIGGRVGQNTDFTREIKLCSIVPKYLEKPCISGLIGGILEFGKPDHEYLEAINLCNSFNENEVQKRMCYGFVINHTKQLYPYEKAIEICNMVDGSYRDTCV